MDYSEPMSIEQTIAELTDGNKPLLNSVVMNLSDLNAEELKSFLQTWSKIELKRRRQIMQRLVELAEGGAGVGALHQFTPYKWFLRFDEALQPIYEKYDYDNKPRPERVVEIMTAKGYNKDGEGFWVGPDGKRLA